MVCVPHTAIFKLKLFVLLQGNLFKIMILCSNKM